LPLAEYDFYNAKEELEEVPLLLPHVHDSIGNYFNEVKPEQWKSSNRSLSSNEKAIAFTNISVYSNSRFEGEVMTIVTKRHKKQWS
jgi:hypothetical protein